MSLLTAVKRLAASTRSPADVRVELTRQLYAALPTNLAIAFATLVSSIVIGIHLHAPAFFWIAGAGGVTTVVRGLQYLYFRRHGADFDTAQADRWTRLYGFMSVGFAATMASLLLQGLYSGHAPSTFVIADLMMLYTAQSARGSTRPWIALSVGFLMTAALLSGVASGHSPLFWGLAAFLSLFYLAYIGSVLVYQKGLLQQMDAQRDVEYLARHDSLTGLCNRAHFSTVLAEAVAQADAKGRALAVHFIDLDRFKPVNDSYGHERGDALLRAVADRLAQACNNVGIASRIGGDEFIVLQTEVEDDVAAVSFGQAVCDALAEVGAPLGVSASVGMAMYPKDGATADDVVRNADLALYDAKAAGRALFRCYDMSSAERMRERQALINDLRAAVENGGFHLAYQPQARTRDGEVEGFEALARWTHPQLGPIGPDTFIPIAEEAGVICALGAWVLETACRQAAGWSAPLCIAVNLSPSQILSGGLPELVAKVLADTGLDPSRLELEITESIFIEDTEHTLAALNAVKAMGVRIAMDDFGTGYSSLSYLQAFAFDRIKIDRSFVSNLETNNHSRAIVKAVTSLGRALGVPVLAEGVETDAQRVLLVAEGCTEFQGYLLGRPAAIESFSHLTWPDLEVARQVAAQVEAARLQA